MCLEISNNLLLDLCDAPKCIFFYELTIFWAAKQRCKDSFSTLNPLSMVIFATATVLACVLLCNSRFNFHCYTQREATPTQKLARKCAAPSRDFLHKRLQCAFTLANQLHWITQYLGTATAVQEQRYLFLSICAFLCIQNATTNPLLQWFHNFPPTYLNFRTPKHHKIWTICTTRFSITNCIPDHVTGEVPGFPECCSDWVVKNLSQNVLWGVKV